MKNVSIHVFVISVGLFGAATVASAQQPFQNIQQAPTTSPYLNLIARQGQGLPAYQSLVQPQLQQQEDFNKQQNQIQNLQSQQKSLSTGGLTQPTRGVSNAIRGTGHPIVYMDYSHYYNRTPTRPASN